MNCGQGTGVLVRLNATLTIGALPQTPALIAARLDLQNTLWLLHVDNAIVILNGTTGFARLTATIFINYGCIYLAN